MPLICSLGFHRPPPIARWNHGYYFSKCKRCGADLVRTAYGRWQVPKGFRVIWQAQPPAHAEAATLEPIAAPKSERLDATDDSTIAPLEPPPEPQPAPDITPPPSEAAHPLPDEVSEPVSTGELAGDALVAGERDDPPAPDPAPAPVMVDLPAQTYRWRAIPDFMDDEADRARAAARPPAPQQPDAAVESARTPRPPFLARMRPFASGVTRQWERYRTRRAAVASEKDLATIEVEHMGSPAIAFLLSVILIAVIIYFAGRPAQESAETVRATPPMPAVAPAPPIAPAQPRPLPSPTTEVAFVTASIVSCRLAPAQQAPRARNIVRGERVAVLGRDENWASISYRGRQCWVLSRYISQVEAL